MCACMYSSKKKGREKGTINTEQILMCKSAPDFNRLSSRFISHIPRLHDSLFIQNLQNNRETHFTSQRRGGEKK